MARKPKVIPVEPERTEVCKSCHGSHFQDQEFRCRRHPPTPVYNVSTGVIECIDPVVDADHWCIDFAPKLNS